MFNNDPRNKVLGTCQRRQTADTKSLTVIGSGYYCVVTGNNKAAARLKTINNKFFLGCMETPIIVPSLSIAADH